MNNLNIEGELRTLDSIRYDWSDKIPEDVLHSIHEPGTESPKYKVRVAWFQIIITQVGLYKDRGLLSEDTRQLYDSFLDYIKTEGFKGQNRLTNRQDIEKGNLLLDRVLTDLNQLTNTNQMP